ncbi:hypothetical protein M8J76_012893 [Diaphorina citri]|nr:hypothetical protein M8J75_006194 [Diaphorina citri]KAI5709212.1 hypothetical protein M8J76_012893 [Diaphorina citri]
MTDPVAPSLSAPPPPELRPQPSSRPTNQTLTLPYLTPQRQLSLCRGDPLCTIVNVPLQVNAQDNLPAAVYDQLVQLTTVELGITPEHFTRMWKTILLKRAQDVYERAKSVRPPNHVRLAPQVIVPAPLGDVLYSLGNYMCNANGVNYHLVPPPQAAPAEDWWTINANIVTTWNQTMARYQKLYVMRESPLPSNNDGKTIIMTGRNVQQDLVSVRAHLNTIELSDGLIHAVNDNLFPNDHLPYNNQSLQVLSNQSLPNLRSQYVASYVLDSNA